LIVDEVLAVGDVQFQKKCMGKMQEVAASGRTVLFVSHNMQALQQLCTRALFLERGTIAGTGSVTEMIQRYLHHAPQQQDARGIVDLAQPGEDRGGSGEARFDAIQVTPLPGAAGAGVAAWPRLRIRLWLTPQTSLDRVAVMLRIKNRWGSNLFQANSAEAGLEVPALSSGRQCRLECMVEAHNLIPGEYQVEIALQRPPARTPLDHLPTAATFEVEEPIHGDWCDTNKHGVVYFPLDWRCQTEGCRAHDSLSLTRV
jgi:lipopolysaccharide transport system ATP-binding protein